MAFLENVKGTWGIGNFRLPDFGLTELIAGGTGKSSWLNNPNVYASFGETPQSYATIISTNKLYSDYQQNKGFNPYGPTVTSRQLSNRQLSNTTSGGASRQLSNRQLSNTTSGGGGGGGAGGGGTPNPETTYVFDPTLEITRKLGDIQREIAERENRIRGTIESGYNEFIRRLDELAGLYPQWQQEDITRLQTSRQTGLQGLEQAKQSGLEKLGLAREQTLQQEQQAKADIMSQLRQLLKASQMKAGLMGAGWSSATQEVLPAALGKQAAQAGAQVARGTISNLNQIAQKEVDVRNTFELAKNELEQDFNAKMDEIAQRYIQLKTWIETKKANAGLKKAQALAALDENLMNNMINEANMYKQMYLQQQQALRQWVMNRLAQLQDYKIQLGQMGNFSPEQLTYQALQGLGGLTGRVGQGGWGEDIFGSLVDTAKRKRELLGL